MVCDEGYEIRGRLGGVGAKLECKEDGSWESPVSSKHSKQFPFCKGKHLRYDYMKTDSHQNCLLIPLILFPTSQCQCQCQCTMFSVTSSQAKRAKAFLIDN